MQVSGKGVIIKHKHEGEMRHEEKNISIIVCCTFAGRLW